MALSGGKGLPAGRGVKRMDRQSPPRRPGGLAKNRMRRESGV